MLATVKQQDPELYDRLSKETPEDRKAALDKAYAPK